MKFYVYKVLIDDKNSDEVEINLNDDLVECQWIGLDDLPKIKLTPLGEELFKKLGYLEK